MDNEEKWKLLLKYAENFPINDFPGFTNIMSLDSKYIKVSDNELPIIGYKNQDQVFATDYYNMPCQACENAETMIKEDLLTLNHEIKILSYHQFDNDWMILLGHKKPIVQQNEVVGTIANFMDITHGGIIDMARFLLKNSRKITKNQFSYVIQNQENFWGLTKKEQECLFFIIRGYSYGEIAKKLAIAITTVQTHIEHIKVKFDVQTKSQLIEKAIQLGFMAIIPGSLFK